MPAPLTRAFVYAVFVFVLGLNVAATLKPFEDWPFTPAPMFAHYVDSTMPRYRFIFRARLDDGSEKELGYYSVGAQWSLMRFFLKYVYGAVADKSPFAIFKNDTKADFEERMSRFFKTFSTEFAKRQKRNEAQLRSIDVSVGKLSWDDNSVSESQLVGSYSTADERFSHRWVTP